MAPSQPQALTRSQAGLSRISPAVRAIVHHERVAALLCASATAAVAFAPRIRGGGFTADDWPLYALVRFPKALGFDNSLAGIKVSAGSRIGAILYWLAGFSVFGDHTRLYAVLAALLAVVMAFSVYILVRELGFSIAQSLAIMLLTIAVPYVATVRFWFTPSGSQIALALAFFGATLALRAFSATGRDRALLHVASWSLYALSALYAEVALPLIVVVVLVYLTRARPVDALRRWGFDLIIVVVGYWATLSFVNETRGFGKLPHSLWPEHARLIFDQALTIFTSIIDPFFGSRSVALIALAILAAAGLALSRSSRTTTSSRRDLRRSALAFSISLIAIIASFATFVPAMLYYEPLGQGLASHIDIVIAAPLAIGVIAVLMFARAVIAELLERVRSDSGSIAAAALVIGWFVAIFVNGLHDVRNDGHIWAVAAGRSRRVLTAMTVHLPNPVHGSTIYTFGEAGILAEMPIFFTYWELTNAVKIAYNRGDLSAFPVVAEDDTVECAPDGIVALGSTPFNQPSPYRQSYFFDVPSGRYRRIDSRKACVAAVSIFHPGPTYENTTLKWSL